MFVLCYKLFEIITNIKRVLELFSSFKKTSKTPFPPIYIYDRIQKHKEISNERNYSLTAQFYFTCYCFQIPY